MEGDAEIDFLGINNENIDSKYLQLLEEIVPAEPVKIDSKTQEMSIQLLNLCDGILEKEFNRYRLPVLQHCGNAFLGFALDRYAAQEPFSGNLGRHEQITKNGRSPDHVSPSDSSEANKGHAHLEIGQELRSHLKIRLIDAPQMQPLYSIAAR